MKVYIAGAITNNPRYKERFEEAEKRLNGGNCYDREHYQSKPRRI